MEVMTVVLIIGVLTAVALPQYRRAIQKAQATEAISMLRAIADSKERLSDSYGYRTFASFAANEPGKAVFAYLDMFDDNKLKCSFAGATMTCDHFVYNLMGGDGANGSFVSARKLNSPYAGTVFRLYHSGNTAPQLKCTGNSDGCAFYNIEEEAN